MYLGGITGSLNRIVGNRIIIGAANFIYAPVSAWITSPVYRVRIDSAVTGIAQIDSPVVQALSPEVEDRVVSYDTVVGIVIEQVQEYAALPDVLQRVALYCHPADAVHLYPPVAVGYGVAADQVASQLRLGQISLVSKVHRALGLAGYRVVGHAHEAAALVVYRHINKSAADGIVVDGHPRTGGCIYGTEGYPVTIERVVRDNEVIGIDTAPKEEW